MGIDVFSKILKTLPVVLWSEVSPMIGMLMMPKTCMYVWAVVMGYNEVKRNMDSD